MAIYKNLEKVCEETFRHHKEETMKPLPEQIDFRLQAVSDFIELQNFEPSSIDIVSARGGVLKPIKGGTYNINAKMVSDLKERKYGSHASSLSALIADKYRKTYGAQAVITDPVVVDELIDEVRLTGLKEIERKSVFHALNQKAVARKYANDIGENYEDINVIVCHMGGGITVGAHRNGRVIDVNDGLSGEGPLSPSRTGSLPNAQLAKYIIDNRMSYEEVFEMLTQQGGFISLADTQNAIELEQRAADGDRDAILIFEALAVQISKETASRAAVLKGRVDRIIFTGGLAYSDYLIDLIRPYVSFISELTVYPGEEEMRALAEGALRVISGAECMKTYE